MPFAGLRRTLNLARGASRAAWALQRKRGIPPSSGRVTMRGVDATVEIVRDRYGVPHVFANSTADAFFGQGVVHAQDRLFQLMSVRLLASGRLAEILGPAGIESDRMMRRIGLGRLSRQDAAELASDQRELIEAYLAGVNETIRALDELPPEFALVGEPEPWRLEDAMLIGRMLMFGFASDWQSELSRAQLLEVVGPEMAALLDQQPDTRLTASRAPVPAGERLRDAAAVEAGIPAGGGSNAWAVTSAHTSTGAPLLASDPHVEVRLPGIFHVTHLDAGALNAVGADVPGIPGIAIGHNESLAWGITAGLADVADVYVETMRPGSPAEYQTPDGWARAEVVIETIEVAGARSVEEPVLITRHGPIIEPAAAGEDQALALRCTALERGDIVEPFIALWHASNLDEFEEALDGWPGSTFNFVVATNEDRVAYRLAGKVPNHAPGEGLLPRDGAISPGPPPPHAPRDLPRLIDPPDGVVVTANHAPGGPLELGADFCEPWRAQRIEQLLAESDAHDVASFQRMHVDVYSEVMSQLRDCVVEAISEPQSGESRTVQAARSLLLTWDGCLAADSAAAAIVETTYQEIARDLAERMAGPAADLVLGRASRQRSVSASSPLAVRLQGTVLAAVEAGAPPWYVDERDRDRRVRAALDRAIEHLAEHLGNFPSRWSWGALHPYRPAHTLAATPLLGRLLRQRARPMGGDLNTVFQSSYSVHDGPERLGWAPAYRQVMDLADWDRSTFQLPTGNSGVPGHRHYDDCIDEYLAGEQRPLLFTREAIEDAEADRYVIEPATGEGTAGE
jgi:penicillin amidase